MKMGHLGVSTANTTTANKLIIAQKALRDWYKTGTQVRYLCAVWKPSGHYREARELYDWFKQQNQLTMTMFIKETQRDGSRQTKL
jgi:hypothetical protein